MFGDGSGPERQGNDMNHVKIRTAAAALVVGGALVVAVPGLAGAAPPRGGKACAVAEKRLPVLESRQAKLSQFPFESLDSSARGSEQPRKLPHGQQWVPPEQVQDLLAP